MKVVCIKNTPWKVNGVIDDFGPKYMEICKVYQSPYSKDSYLVHKYFFSPDGRVHEYTKNNFQLLDDVPYLNFKSNNMKTLNKKDRESIKNMEKQIAEIKSRYMDERPVMERIKSFEDALTEVDITDEEEDLWAFFKENANNDPQVTSTFAHFKLCIIARALNEGWTPDWTDDSEYKYYPWMEYKEGVGFSFDGHVYAFTFSSVGSRLCFKSPELAKYAGEQFQDLYNQLFT